MRDHDLLHRRRQWMNLARREARVAEHSFKFRKRVSIAARRRAEHHHTERGGHRRRNPIFIWHKLEGHCSATGGERCVNFLEQCLASRRIEMVQEVCQQYYVVVTSKIDVECATRYCAEAINHARGLSILSSDRQNTGPIDRRDFRL